MCRLPFSAVASNPPSDLVLTPLTGKGLPLSAYLVQYHLLFVVLDPFTNEASWILPTAVRVLETFEQADVRVAFVVSGANPDEAKQFLGPHARTIMTFPDADRSITRALGLDTLPALVHIAMDGKVVSATEGWNADAWQNVTDEVARQMRWIGPILPDPRDPGAFAGTSAKG